MKAQRETRIARLSVGGAAPFDRLRAGWLRALRSEAESRGQKSEVGGQKAKSKEHERLKISDFRFQIDLKKNRRSDRSRVVPL